MSDFFSGIVNKLSQPEIPVVHDQKIDLSRFKSLRDFCPNRTSSRRQADYGYSVSLMVTSSSSKSFRLVAYVSREVLDDLGWTPEDKVDLKIDEGTGAILLLKRPDGVKFYPASTINPRLGGRYQFPTYEGMGIKREKCQAVDAEFRVYSDEAVGSVLIVRVPEELRA